MQLACRPILAGLLAALFVTACGGQDSYGAPITDDPFLVVSDREVPVLIYASSPPATGADEALPKGPSPSRLIALVFHPEDGCSLSSADVAAPASIGWLSVDGEIESIQDIDPDTAAMIEPAVFCPYAVIAVQGWFEEREVYEGDAVHIPEATQTLLNVSAALNRL